MVKILIKPVILLVEKHWNPEMPFSQNILYQTEKNYYDLGCMIQHFDLKFIVELG